MAKTFHSTSNVLQGTLCGDNYRQTEAGDALHHPEGDVKIPPSPNLLIDKKAHNNGHSSPARITSAGKTTPSTEKKPQINGQPSPVHLPTINNFADVEGFMRTDDRMRLAKERREERDKSLVAREQLIREKERRARLQYERTVEERWRRLEEQKQKEELRRAAVEEKRRHQLEEEKERLEALMKRSLERSLQLEQRGKRWSRMHTTDAGYSENVQIHFSAASALSHGIACPFPAASESAPCSPHRSPYRGTLNPTDHKRGVQGGSQSTPNTPKKERLRRARRTASPAFVSPVRRSESPAAAASKHLASPTSSKLTSNNRAQSPVGVRQLHSSPIRRNASPLADNCKKVEDKKMERHDQESTTDTSMKKKSNFSSIASPNASSHIEINTEKNVANTENQNHSSKTEITDKESPAQSPAGKLSAGTTSAEEASRLLAERRRQAREQRGVDEKKREREEKERMKAELLKKEQAQKPPQREKHDVKEERKTQEVELQRQKEENVKQLKEEHHTQMESEREKVKEHAKDEEERQRQDRELQKQQEEEERQLRKKRIDEIMKRTRKCDADFKEGQMDECSVSPPGILKMHVHASDQMNKQKNEKVEFQGKKQEDTPLEKDRAEQMDNQKSVSVKIITEQVTSTKSVPKKDTNREQVGEHQGTQININGPSQPQKQADRKTEVQVNNHNRALANGNANDHKTTDSSKKADAKTTHRDSVVTNGEVQFKGGANDQLSAEVSKQQRLRVAVTQTLSTSKGKATGRVEVAVTKPSATLLSVGYLSPPTIKLEPLDVKGSGSGDEVRSMEVSPVTKEELISIPEFSPGSDVQVNSMSNSRALEDLLDLTGHVAYPKMSSDGNTGDCNKNLIEGVVSPTVDSKLMQPSPQTSQKIAMQK